MKNADALEAYAKKIFGQPDLSRFVLLVKEEERVRHIARALEDLHTQKESIPVPVPKSVVDYIGNNKMGMNLYLAVLPTG